MPNNLIKQAYLFGPVGKAIYQKSSHPETWFCLAFDDDEDAEEQPCHPGEINLLSDVAPEYSIIYETTLGNLRKVLKELTYAYDALTFVLNGLNKNLSERIRRMNIDTANDLCKYTHVDTFVQNRLLGYPFPQGVDLEGAITFAQGCEKIQSLYERVKENQNILQIFHNVWQTVANEFFPHQETEQARILRFLVNKGVIRDWVTTTNWLDFKKLWQTPPEDEERLLEKLNLSPERLQKLFVTLRDEFANRIQPPVKCLNAWVAPGMESIRRFLEESITKLNLSVAGHYRDQREQFSRCQSFLLVVDDNTPDNLVIGYLEDVYKYMRSGRVIIVKQGSMSSILSRVDSFKQLFKKTITILVFPWLPDDNLSHQQLLKEIGETP